MPLLGFGTWQLEGEEAQHGTESALAAGYRHIDTATVYENEREVGTGLRSSGIPRESVFLTTKLPPHLAGKELQTLERSLELLGTDYVDLWLIHWAPDEGVGADIWHAFAEAVEQGLAHDIGVSNHEVVQIDELAAATGVGPAVNQIEWSPLLFDRASLEAHRERGVALEGYSGLRGGVLEDATVLEISQRLDRTPAQVVIRWHLQHGVLVIPKSRDPERIRANALVGDFELSHADVDALDALAVDR